MSILGMQSGYKDSSQCWKEVFKDLIRRGVDPVAIQIGVMDGLPGLESVFREVFVNAKTGRCWVHSLRNALSKTPKRLQDAFIQLAQR